MESCRRWRKMTQAERIGSLDGLRGVACIVVFLMHLCQALRPFGDIQYRLIPGGPAVEVFFVLSGVVLALGPLGVGARGDYPWYGYFPRRIVRLMFPLFFAVLLGVAFVVGAQLLGVSAPSLELDTIRTGEGARVLMHDIIAQFDFLFYDASRSNSPTWSMKWELWFSLALPLWVYLVRLTRKDSIAICAIFFAIALSYIAVYPAIRQCLMFVVGVFLGKNIHALHDLQISRFASFIILLISLILIELPELQRGGYLPIENFASDAFMGTLRDLGCTLLVFLAINRGIVNRFLSMGMCRFFGKLSYSLYLTHAVVISAAYLVFDWFGFIYPVVECLIIIPLSLAATYAFWFFIERPSIEWSRRIGQRAMRDA